MAKQKYTDEYLVQWFKDFIDKNKRVPTAIDIQNSLSMPSVKTLDRRYGGIVAFRQKFGLGGDCRKGEIRSALAKSINKMAYYQENEIYIFLINKFDKMRVHRYAFINDISQYKCDYKIFLEDGTSILIDVFCPSRIDTLTGCVNIKYKKYRSVTCDFYFVCLNETMKQHHIDDWKEKRKNKLPDNFKIMAIDTFKNFISLL